MIGRRTGWTDGVAAGEAHNANTLNNIIKRARSGEFGNDGYLLSDIRCDDILYHEAGDTVSEPLHFLAASRRCWHRKQGRQVAREQVPESQQPGR